MNNLISVIVPIYNDEKYIDKCINCLINQSYTNLEILLIVDGANDKSFYICKEYEKKDKRIKVFYKENGGTADTRNYGLDKATGDYIGFMDSDDFIPNNFFEVLINLCLKTNAKISAVGLKEVNENRNISINYNEEIQVLKKEEMYRNLFNDNLFGNFVWNKLYKKEIFDEVKFIKIKKIEDLAVMYKIFEKADFLAFNSSKLYCWIQRKDSQLHNLEKSHYTCKYLIVKNRFYFINNMFSNMIENKIFFIKVILECLPYLKENNKKDAKIELTNHYKEVKEFLNIKARFKYHIFQIFM